MKKNYQKPEVTVFNVAPRAIMSGSNLGGPDADGSLANENNSDGLWY